MMKRQILVLSLVFLWVGSLASAANIIYVPDRDIETIQDGIDAASSGDEVRVDQGVWTGHGNVNLDFHGKAITLISSGFNVNAPEWTIVAATIIDVAGDRKNPNRAFNFHSGEGNGSKIIGFTIRNGYMTGGNGRDGGYTTIGGVYQPNPFRLRGSYTDPCAPRGEDGAALTGSGYGGAILCAGSSPTIQFCTITNCVVTGGQGGDGAAGLSGPWTYRDIFATPNPISKTTNDGQWGGWGGNGSGNGYGGAIACLGGSSPVIRDCNFVNNAARGGCGGNGGNGGIAATNGTGGVESFGGEAGNGNGDGIGGAVFCDNLSSSPAFVNCGFRGNVARTGIVAVGGVKGLGTAGPAPIGSAKDGNDGAVSTNGGVAGGATYHRTTSNPKFTNCTFMENKAYTGEDAATLFTVGGALYFDSKNVVDINNCEFIGNLGGAIRFGPDGTLTVKSSYDPNRSSIFQNNQAYDGGAIFVDSNNMVSLSNCAFLSNSALFDGGAFKCKSDANMTNCTFGDNTADGYGGGMDAYRSGTTLKIDANNCIFAGNQSNKGGGFSSLTVSAKFKNCYFNGNTAERGGGLDLVRGDVNFIGGNINGNTATDGDGGGMRCQQTQTNINDCTLSNNSTVNISGSGGYGGAINFEVGVSGQKIFNCLITGNSASKNGGAISCGSAAPAIGNCTFSGDSAGSYGGAIFADFESEPNIINSIFNNCSKHAIHEEDVGGNAIVRYSLFYNNTDGDFYDSGTQLVYKGAGQIGSIPGGSNNRYGDPLFETGPLGAFYLNQSTSPAKDRGSVNANILGLNTYTTSTNNIPDSGLVDIGYHEPNSSGFPTFTLTASVIGGQGTISPTTGSYIAGTVVTLTATPSAGWRVKEWKGADAGGSALVNTATMNSNKTVTVEFEPPRMLLVSVGGGSGFYSSIQDAITAAKDGDKIVVYPGVYHGGYSGRIVTVDKSVTITSLHPDDPTCVASTIIDGYSNGGNQWLYRGVEFYPNTNSSTVLDGFTIRNCGGTPRNGDPGDRGKGHPDGYDGGHTAGAAIFAWRGASPVIKNCVIRDNQHSGSRGGDGVAADATRNAGRGGWGGASWGGAIYCGPQSSPTFINCRIINNKALGGNGGNGGNGVALGSPGGVGNYGGNWSKTGSSTYGVTYYDPFSLNFNSVSGPLWAKFTADYNLNAIGDFSYAFYFPAPYVGDYRWYSGLGGGAFCDVDSNVTFIDCNIIGNLVKGGMSGLGGATYTGTYPQEPIKAYEIPAFGGGVYCRAGSTVKFDGCVITDNVASRRMDVVDPNNVLDPYLGHGGGICAEDTAKVIITNCSIGSNQANVGGGIHFANANAVITDSRFLQNAANHGGGLFGENGLAQITGCDFTGNTAISHEPNDINDPLPSLLGQGGGMHLWAADVNIFDCNLTQNHAQYSGGGMYVGGEGTFWLDNCLLTNNNSRRDGGAISNNIFAQLTVSNCTIANNRVTGSGEGVGFGGGISSFYNSYSDIIDSIIWGNKGIRGSQIAVGTSYFYDPAPSAVKITYSDITPFLDPNQILKPDGIDVAFCIDTTGSMYGDIAAVKTQMNQIIDEIAKVSPNYRIAVVDFRDFDDPNGYGGTGDYPYHNALDFSNNPAAITAGIDSLSASGGGDGPESVYSAVMHCIDGTGLDNRLAATGNNRFIDANSPPLIWRSGNISRIVILMGDAQPHDPEPFTNYTISDVVAAAIAGPESKLIFTIPVRNDPTTVEFFTKLGEDTGGAMLQATDSSQVVNAILKAIQMAFVIQNPIYIEGGCTLFGWQADSNSWDPNTHNIDKDPNFTAGYYLSQIAAGQDINSPCVNAGSDLASVLGMDTYTTRTDGIFDANIVDMGYHYRHATTTYTLTAIVIGGHGTVEPSSVKIHYGYENNVITLTAIPEDGYRIKQWRGTDNDYSTDLTNTVTLTEDKTVTVEFELIPIYQLTATVIGGHGSIDPTGGTYPQGTTVILKAIPDTDYRVKQWNGTNNDSLTTKTNEVTIDSNTTVTVEFEHTQVLQVPGKYSSIQQAFDAAKDGDTILVGTGVWGTSQGYTIGDKDITLTSTNPDDPCVVANTIIQMIMPPNGGGWVGPAFTFFNVGPGTLLNGITIRGFRMRGGDGLAPTSPERDGENGFGVAGGAISCRYNASPTIKNCIFDDCNVTGGNGSNGVAGTGTSVTDPNRHGGHGGWPGFALGGAIACLNNSNPAIINCTFTNCAARGGNGGDGGNGSGSPNFGKGGRGGGWYYGLGSFWYGMPWTYGYHISNIFTAFDVNTIYNGQYDFYTRYSGHGGAVYVGTGCSPTFTHCNFVNNNSFSGVSGISGQDYGNMGRDEPSSRWIIDNSGGAVYCDNNSTPRFTDCVFNNNAADTNSSAANDDPHVSFGGAIAFEDGAFPTIERCSFNGNNATAGGGVYAADAKTQISDSNFTDNTAYNGGALYSVDSNIGMANCNITGNQAVFPDFNDPNVATSIGQGGGIYSGSSETGIFDCNIRNNLSNASGGGVYFSGQGDYLLRNCLLTENTTGRDGGGVSANWYSNLWMANCTMANNMATGAGFGASYGGGLYCSYQSYASVIDSILWNNSAGIGAQIAIGTGFEYDKRPSVVDVDYSDVQGGAASVYVDIGNVSDPTDNCKLNWGTKNLTGTSLTNPKFVKGFYLSQPITGDSNQAVLGLSICVDKGSTDAGSAGMYRHTTRTDRVPEAPDSIVDMGYHYVLPIDLLGNFNFDSHIDFLDYILFADHWMSTDCGFPDWCYGTDLDRNGVVNWGDFALFAANYGAVSVKGPNEPNDPNANDHTPPSPSPMTWASVPASAGATSIAMTATTATDNSTGTNVEYYFQRTDGTGNPDGTIRNWGTGASYTDSTAFGGLQYGYRVKARDTTVNHNETGWSVIGYAVAGSVAIPTAPSGLTATPVSATQINLSWTDNSSNETGFKIERKIGSGSFSQIDTVAADVKTYNNTGLTAATTYSYRVRSYNGSGDSGYSNTITATTPADGNQLPTPIIWYDYTRQPADGNNSGQTKTDPNGSSSSYWWHKIVTPVPTGTPLVYYRFYCTSQSGFSSQWVPSNGTGNVVYPPIGSGNPNPVIKYGSNAITYCVPVTTGSTGLSLNWRVDVSFNPDGSGTQNHSSTVTIIAP